MSYIDVTIKKQPHNNDANYVKGNGNTAFDHLCLFFTPTKTIKKIQPGKVNTTKMMSNLKDPNWELVYSSL